MVLRVSIAQNLVKLSGGEYIALEVSATDWRAKRYNTEFIISVSKRRTRHAQLCRTSWSVICFIVYASAESFFRCMRTLAQSNLWLYAVPLSNLPRDSLSNAQVIFPHEANLKSAAGKSDDLETLCNDKEVQKVALRELNASGKKAGFKQMEVNSTMTALYPLAHMSLTAPTECGPDTRGMDASERSLDGSAEAVRTVSAVLMSLLTPHSAQATQAYL